MPKTEIIRFDDSDDWWELRNYLPVALERDFIQHAVDAQATILTKDNPEPNMDLIMSLAERMDELVVKSTISWSYGPVDMDTFYDVVPGHHYTQVAQWVGETYGPLVSKSIERGLEVYTSLSNQTEVSQ